MDNQKTIYEKWEESDINVLPRKKLGEREILLKLKSPDAEAEEKAQLIEILYENIETKGEKEL